MANNGGNKRAKEAPLHCFDLVQQLKPEYWSGWGADELARGAVGIVDGVIRRLLDAGMVVAECHGIIHDKDVQVSVDPDTLFEVEVPKAAHVDLVAKFWQDPQGKWCGGTLDRIADAIGVEPQYVGKLGRGSHAYDNRMSYVVHAKDPDKFQYSPMDVYSGGCSMGDVPLWRPYQAIYAERIGDWRRGAAVKKKKPALKADRKGLEILMKKIMDGEIVNQNQLLLTDGYAQVYAMYRGKIKDAFAAAGELSSAKMLRDFKAGGFHKIIIWIHAPSGKGKTNLAKACVEMVKRFALKYWDQRWRDVELPGRHAMDQYGGQEIIVLNDAEYRAMDAPSWKNFLDPYNVAPASARFYNKESVPFRACIITSTMTVERFFEGFHDEAMDQFVRRIDPEITVFRMGKDGETFYRLRSPVELAEPVHVVREKGRSRSRLPGAPSVWTDSLQFIYGDDEWVTGEAAAAAAVFNRILDASPDFRAAIETSGADIGGDEYEDYVPAAPAADPREKVWRAFEDYVYRETTRGLDVRDGGREYKALSQWGAGWRLEDGRRKAERIVEHEWRRNDWFDKHSDAEVDELFEEWLTLGGSLPAGRLERADPNELRRLGG